MSVQELKIINPKTRQGLRNWLKKNHRQSTSVWVKVYKAKLEGNFLRTIDVVEECLCFGWVDSRPRKNDKESFFLLISARKPKSVWSAINKKKVSILIEKGLMTTDGLEKIKQAKINGSWNFLNKSDKLILPEDLKKSLAKNSKAKEQFDCFSKSSRRTLLEWIYSAKSEATKKDRIEKTVEAASRGLKANLKQRPL